MNLGTELGLIATQDRQTHTLLLVYAGSWWSARAATVGAGARKAVWVTAVLECSTVMSYTPGLHKEEATLPTLRLIGAEVRL